MALFVYISAADSNEIFVLRMDAATGALSAPLQVMSLTDIMGHGPGSDDIESMPLTITPDRRFLYAALRYEPFTVVSFGIDAATGRLDLLGTGPLAHSMSYIATDKNGCCLLGASYRGNLVAINRIGATGIVDDKPSQVIPFRLNAHSVMTDRDSRHVYASILGEDRIMWRPFNAATGRMPIEIDLSIPFAPGLGPRHFRFHPNGRFLYANTEQGGTVNVYRLDHDAAQWTAIQSVSAMPPGFVGTASAADLHITPDGRFLYTSERSLDAITGFAIDAGTGTLAFAGRFPTEKKPRSFAIDPSGRFLVAVGQHSHHASVSEIDQRGGGLTARFRYPVGHNPGWVEIIELPTGAG